MPTTSHGAASTVSDQRSLTYGSSAKPAISGPKIQPSTFTAYALPALPGSPPDRRSTSIGVRKPSRNVNGTTPRISRNPFVNGVPGLDVISGSSAAIASNDHSAGLS